MKAATVLAASTSALTAYPNILLVLAVSAAIESQVPSTDGSKKSENPLFTRVVLHGPCLGFIPGAC